MRIRDGFTLESVPTLRRSSERRFLYLDEPTRSGPDSLVVLGAGTRLETLATLQASLVLAEDAVAGIPEKMPVLRIRDARSALAAILHALSDRIERETPYATGSGNTVHPTAVIEGVLEGGVTVEAGVVVGKGSFIGSGTRLEANSVIGSHVILGRDCVVQSGAVIGCAGFGFFGSDTGIEQMPHLAGVRLGARCFVGANTVIAAGVLHPTELGDDCKLDSHVQIAHNVRLGDRALLASQSGIAGSTVIGNNFRMGGAASIAGHLRIGDDVSVAAKAGVTKDVADGLTVAGFPARPIAEWRRDKIKMKNEK